MSLIIKAALLKGDETFVFRRFTIKSEELDYENLKRKIKGHFPVDSAFMWKDADCDMVTFSSDEELQEALKCTSDGVLKIYIAEKQCSQTKDGQTCRLRDEDVQKSYERTASVVSIDAFKFLAQLMSGKPAMSRRHNQQRKRFIETHQQRFDEDEAEWFKRRQQKWQKRHENSGSCADSCTKGGNVDRLQQRLDRLRTKLANINLGNIEPGNVCSETADDLASHLQKRIDRIGIKLANLNVGNDSREKDEADFKTLSQKGTNIPRKTTKYKQANKGRKQIAIKLKIKDGKYRPVTFPGHLKPKFSRNRWPSNAVRKNKGILFPENPKQIIEVPVKRYRGHRYQATDDFEDFLMEGRQPGFGDTRRSNYLHQKERTLMKKLTKLEGKKAKVQMKLNHGCNHTQNCYPRGGKY